MTLRIRRLHALEILDSRGNPTVSVTVELADSTMASAQVPSGASTGRHEAVELRDGDPGRYAGKGVRRAVENVGSVLGPALEGFDAENQAGLDRRMMEADGTPDKSCLGANALLGVSCAAARAVAVSRRIPPWRRLAEFGTRPSLPVPMVNILSGNLHAGGNIEFQDFLIIPHGFPSCSDALEATTAVHRTARRLIEAGGYVLTGVADEGGWGPRLESNEKALELLTRSIGEAGYEPKRQISIALDVAASHFYHDGAYHLKTEGRVLSAGQMTDLLAGWAERYPILSIEDGLEQDDWAGWQAMTGALGSRMQLVGDDFFTTNPGRVKRGIDSAAANSVLVKMNQIGTLTETFEVIRMAAEAGFTAVISARSGETEDSFLADLAIASGAGQIKIGSITRSERLAKYNRLLEVEAGGELPFVGPGPFRRFLGA